MQSVPGNNIEQGHVSNATHIACCCDCRCCGCAFRSYKEFLQPEDARLAGIKNKGKYMPAARQGSTPRQEPSALSSPVYLAMLVFVITCMSHSPPHSGAKAAPPGKSPLPCPHPSILQ